MNTSASVQDLIAALVKARSAFPAIPKNRKVTVSTSHGKYGFEYADLCSILDAVVPTLAENGLVIVNSVDTSDNGGVRATTSLYHVSGQWMETTLSAAPCQDIQKYGSALTYLRRYGICALLGIAGELDDDGNQTVGNAIVSETSRQRPPVSTNGHVPDEPRPTVEQIDALVALAESCGEPKEVFGTTLRRIMGLSGDVRISRKYLRENMHMHIYEMAREHYERLLKAQIEQDVPDHPPPADQVASHQI